MRCTDAPRRGYGLPEPEDRAGLKERESRRLLEQLRGMALEPSRRRYERGDVIYHAGEYGDALYMVSSGAVRLSSRYESTKEATLMLLGANDIFGALIHESTAIQSAAAEAFTSAEVLKVPKTFVERACRSNAEVASTLLKLMELELAQHRELVQRLLPRRTESRLAHVLNDLAGKFGVDSGGTIAIRVCLSHEDLAAMAASTRESVTSAMVRLRERGILDNKSGYIYILDPGGLAKLML